MRSFAHVIADAQGLHARSCVIVATEAAKWPCEVLVSDGGISANGKSMRELLALRAVCGSTLTVRCEGTSEAEAANALAALMRMSI